MIKIRNKKWYRRNVVGDSEDENNFPQKLLLTNTPVSRLCKAFENNLSASIKLSKTQLYEICRSGGFLGKEQVKKQLEILSQILKHKSIIKTNLNLMTFIPEIIYLK